MVVKSGHEDLHIKHFGAASAGQWDFSREIDEGHFEFKAHCVVVGPDHVVNILVDQFVVNGHIQLEIRVIDFVIPVLENELKGGACARVQRGHGGSWEHDHRCGFGRLVHKELLDCCSFIAERVCHYHFYNVGLALRVGIESIHVGLGHEIRRSHGFDDIVTGDGGVVFREDLRPLNRDQIRSSVLSDHGFEVVLSIFGLALLVDQREDEDPDRRGVGGVV